MAFLHVYNKAIEIIVNDAIDDNHGSYFYGTDSSPLINYQGFISDVVNLMKECDKAGAFLETPWVRSECNSDTFHDLKMQIFAINNSKIYFDTPPVETMLECDDCGINSPDVSMTFCPYSEEIHSEEVECNLCEECYRERCYDI